MAFRPNLFVTVYTNTLQISRKKNKQLAHQFQQFYIFSVIDILPLDSTNGEGWKLNKTFCASGKTGEQLKQCIKEMAYSSNDILEISNNGFRVKTYFESTYHALCHTIEIGYSNSSDNLVFSMTFKNNLSFYLQFKDPKLQFLSLSSETVPRTMQTVRPNIGFIYAHLKVNYLDQ